MTAQEYREKGFTNQMGIFDQSVIDRAENAVINAYFCEEIDLTNTEVKNCIMELATLFIAENQVFTPRIGGVKNTPKQGVNAQRGDFVALKWNCKRKLELLGKKPCRENDILQIYQYLFK